ncbi:MAG: cupin domain-containing protein [Asgard group archaeon]|nr:cupin domain-containing protein [Asgard group archaeon]
MEKIDLSKILEKKEGKMPRSKDGVIVIELMKTEKYSIAYGELLPKEENKKHRLEMQETYYFLEGKGEMIIDGQKTPVKKDVMIKIEPNAEQKLVNTGKEKMKFLMVVNPPYNSTKEEILE